MESYAFLYLVGVSHGRSEVEPPHMLAPLEPLSRAASYHSLIHCRRRGLAHCDDMFAAKISGSLICPITYKDYRWHQVRDPGWRVKTFNNRDQTTKSRD